MSTPFGPLSDERLEAALARRAPHGPDAGLLATIMVEVGQTSQERSWTILPGATRLPSGPRLALLVAIVAVVLALLGAALAGAFRPDPFEATVIVPRASATTEPSPSQRSAGPIDSTPRPSVASYCDLVKGDARVEALPQVDLPRGSDPHVDIGRVAFETVEQGGVSTSSATVWAVGAGSPAKPIARFSTSLGVPNVFLLDTVPGLDGVLVSFQVWRTDFASSCAELFVVRWDGSEVQQLSTTDQGGWTAATAPDGTRIAFHAPSTRPFVVSFTGGEQLLEGSCQQGAASLKPIWSPGSDRLSTVCPESVVVRDLTAGTSMRVPFVVGPELVPLRAIWPTRDQILILSRGFENWSFPDQIVLSRLDVPSGSIRTERVFDDVAASRLDPGMDPWFSPAGDKIVASDSEGSWHIHEIATGQESSIDGRGTWSYFATPWTADGSALISYSYDDGAIFRTLIDGSAPEVIGSLPVSAIYEPLLLNEIE